MWAAVVLLAGTWPAGAEEASGPSNSAAAFDTFSILAQSQMSTGYLYAVGDEEEHVAAAKAAVDKPENVLAIASAFQRGTAAAYTYGATVGGGENGGAGGAGIAPEPPPGEAVGQYPSSPGEMTWEGPLTAGAKGPVLDGRAHAKGTDTPNGKADFTVTHFDAAGALTVDQATSSSRGEAVPTGLEGESASVLQGVTIGGVLKINSLVSRAYGLIPAAPGDTKAVGYTVVEGATVNGTPVQIDNTGIRVSDQAQGTAQKTQFDEQLAKALAGANIEDIRLAQAKIVTGDNGKVLVDAGSLVVRYRDKQLAAANPQGFAGGGFAVGGAMLSLEGQRAQGDTGSASSGAETPLSETGPPSPAAAEPGTSTPAMTTGGTDRLSLPSTKASDDPGRWTAVATEAMTGRGLSAAEPDAGGSPLSETAAAEPPSGLTAEVTPETGTAPQVLRSGRLLTQPAVTTGTPVRESDWLGALYLGLVAVPLLVLVAFRLARSS
jgi:hypothetical protein